MKIRDFKNIFFVVSGCTSRQREANRTPRVLFYHGVHPQTDPWIQGLHIQPDAFIRQMRYLQHHYEIISIEEYYRRFTEQTFTGKEVVLTFDDGYRNNLTVLAPILKSFSLPFTVFVSTNHMDTGDYFPTFKARAVVMCPSLSHLHIGCMQLDAPLGGRRQRQQVHKRISYELKHSGQARVDLICKELTDHLQPAAYRALCDTFQSDAPMTWQEVIRLKNEYGCTIGSHCLDHFICDTFQDEAETSRQISRSKTVIEERLQTPCRYLAYPNGNTCPQALRAVETAGYDMAFNTDNSRLKTDSNPFNLPRYGASFNRNTFMTELAYKPKLRE